MGNIDAEYKAVEQQINTLISQINQLKEYQFKLVGAYDILQTMLREAELGKPETPTNLEKALPDELAGARETAKAVAKKKRKVRSEVDTTSSESVELFDKNNPGF